MVPADGHAETRQTATRGLHRRIIRRSTPHRVACGQPGASERWRLVQWLRMLDGLDENVSPRDLAAALILADASHYSAAEWDASSERRRIARWQRGAIAMRDGGYRRLLGGG
ncbi:DNA -binding domain-containing protein [Sphingopyxis witflariensis]|uniref:DNA -binding domain-containing protein n=1 Tax=Sphingopyxis witflariensis TaxID=173675 RepID=UPI0030141E89